MLTCTRWLTDHARQRPDALALVVGEQRLSFAQLEGQVARCAAALRAAGARPGDRVATLLPNGLAALLICQAAPRIGAVQEGNSGHPDFRRVTRSRIGSPLLLDPTPPFLPMSVRCLLLVEPTTNSTAGSAGAYSLDADLYPMAD